LSPAFAETLVAQPPHTLATAAALAMLISGMVAYRSARTLRHPSRDVETPRAAGWFFHERPIALAFITVAALSHNLPLFMIGYLDPIGALWLAVLLFCLSRWSHLWRRRGQPRRELEWDIAPAKLAAVWLATCLTLLTALPTLALFGFIASVGPWIYWRMFEIV
jgi:hypothetical protein